MERYFVLGSPRSPSSVRFHHILRSDGQDCHDHPWDFMSVILDGSYTEHTPTSSTTHGTGSVLFRKAEALHRLTLDEPVWTVVVTGPTRRPWGFQTERGWVHWSRYRSRYQA